MDDVIRTLCRVAACAIAIAASSACLAFTGHVIDGSTGKPVEGAYVVGRWEGGGGVVVPSSGCTLAITKSDANGDFTVNRGSGMLRALLV